MLEIIRGDNETINLNFTDQNGDAIDLTGSTVFFTVKTNKTDSDDDAVIKAQTAIHTDAVNGITGIVLSNDTSDAGTKKTAGEYWYDLQVVDSLGGVSSMPTQKCKILQDITERTS